MRDIKPAKSKKTASIKQVKKTASVKAAKRTVSSSVKRPRVLKKSEPKTLKARRINTESAVARARKGTQTATSTGRGAVRRVAGTSAAQGAVKAANRARVAVSPRPSSDLPGEVSAKEVAKERTEVLKGAKKYIYPIAQSRFKVVYTSIGLFFVALLTLLGVGAGLLFGLDRVDDFSYRVSRIVPYPVARVEGNFVRFEEYLFEVRQNVHFFSTQDNKDFSTDEGKAILADIQQRSLDKVKARAIVQKVANENKLTVTDDEVELAIAEIVEQSNIGDSEESLKTTLRDFYDWDRSDFERSIRNQLLEQKVLPFVDSGTLNKALAVRDDLRADLDDLQQIAAAESDDLLTRDDGGKLGVISKTDDTLPKEFIDTAFALAVGEVSDPVETDIGIHVIVRQTAGADQGQFAHILFERKDAEAVIIDDFESYDISSYYNIEAFEGDGSVRPDALIDPTEQ